MLCFECYDARSFYVGGAASTQLDQLQLWRAISGQAVGGGAEAGRGTMTLIEILITVVPFQILKCSFKGGGGRGGREEDQTICWQSSPHAICPFPFTFHLSLIHIFLTHPSPNPVTDDAHPCSDLSSFFTLLTPPLLLTSH